MLRKILTAMCGAALCAALAFPQGKFERRFTAGETLRYRVQLTVRSELEGHTAVEAGGRGYSQPLVQTVEMSLAWTATRRVMAVRPTDGSADITETLEEFSAIDISSPHTLEPDAREMRGALRSALDRWRSAEPHVLNYRETSSGVLTGVPQNEVPSLDEEPRLLTPWLLRALRPTAALPEREFRSGQRWEEPRSVEIAGWRNTTGTESGEWFVNTPAGGPPTVRLHIVQQISGAVEGPAGTTGRSSAIGEGRFHAESLSTLAQAGADPRVAQGQLIAATRSASREVIRVLEAVPGMAEPPRFRARISAQVQITLLPE